MGMHHSKSGFLIFRGNLCLNEYYKNEVEDKGPMTVVGRTQPYIINKVKFSSAVHCTDC